ncbi:MAG: hypothetical protein JNL60_18375 [Bacteroidia bacterium]|nr:hypothetical protein [Bacteroidia bacterium]
MNNFRKTISWVIVFSIAMGFLESAVVVYLRELYYSDGFQFPLRTIPVNIARVEFFRELATIFMLVGVGVIAGKTKLERFAYFVFSFAIWDLFYYVFLFVCLDWPESLATWDILFLIPLPWVGPVWAPCLLCLLMIFGSVCIIYRIQKGNEVFINKSQWFLMISGAVICITAFMWDYYEYVSGTVNYWSFLSTRQLFEELGSYMPKEFNYPLFLTGFLSMSLSVLLFILKSKTYEKQS